MMQRLGYDMIQEEGSVDGGSALWANLAAAYKGQSTFTLLHMIDELEMLKWKSGESIQAFWSRTKILRSDLEKLASECMDSSIVQRINRKLKLQPSWKFAVCHLCESVLTIKLATFKPQLQLVEPALVAVVPAHAVYPSDYPGRGGHNDHGRGGCRKWP